MIIFEDIFFLYIVFNLDGYFSIEKLYYRSDRIKKPLTKLKCVKIEKKMGWCDDPLDQKNYNSSHQQHLTFFDPKNFCMAYFYFFQG